LPGNKLYLTKRSEKTMRAWGGGGNSLLPDHHLPSPFVINSSSTLSFNFFLAYFSGWL
jgi:hypothetical protein